MAPRPLSPLNDRHCLSAAQIASRMMVGSSTLGLDSARWRGYTQVVVTNDEDGVDGGGESRLVVTICSVLGTVPITSYTSPLLIKTGVVSTTSQNASIKACLSPPTWTRRRGRNRQVPSRCWWPLSGWLTDGGVSARPSVVAQGTRRTATSAPAHTRAQETRGASESGDRCRKDLGTRSSCIVSPGVSWLHSPLEE